MYLNTPCNLKHFCGGSSYVNTCGFKAVLDMHSSHDKVT
jgi:hypothetical protein